MHFDLQEEVQALQDGTYTIDNEISVRNARPGQVDTALDGEERQLSFRWKWTVVKCSQ
jgi:hypothetical protein